MALSAYAETARDIYVQLVTKGNLDIRGMVQAAEYSFKAAKVFMEHAKEVDAKTREDRRE